MREVVRKGRKEKTRLFRQLKNEDNVSFFLVGEIATLRGVVFVGVPFFCES